MSQNRFTSLFVVLFIIKTQFKRIDKIGLFDYVEHKYGESMMRSVKNDLKATKKILKRNQDILFLNECLSHNVFPKFTNFKSANLHIGSSNLTLEYKRNIISDEIKRHTKDLKKLNKSRVKIRMAFDFDLSYIDVIIIRHRMSEMLEGWKRETVDAMNGKLESLGVVRIKLPKNTDNVTVRKDTKTAITPSKTKIVHNLSSRILTADQLSALEKGLKFGIRSKYFDEIEILTKFEILSQQLNKSNISELKSKENIKLLNSSNSSFLKLLQGMACEFTEMAKTDKTDSLTIQEEKGLNELASDKTIVVTKADKGEAVVILNKKDYHEKLLNLLSDKTKFNCIESDLTIERENRLKNILSNLEKNNLKCKSLILK